jgi:hypothetical protein
MAYPPVTDAPPVAPAVDPGVPKKKKKRSARELDEFLKLARDRFRQADEADSEQRQREIDDLSFIAGNQWGSNWSRPMTSATSPHPSRMTS